RWAAITKANTVLLFASKQDRPKISCDNSTAFQDISQLLSSFRLGRIPTHRGSEQSQLQVSNQVRRLSPALWDGLSNGAGSRHRCFACFNPEAGLSVRLSNVDPVDSRATHTFGAYRLSITRPEPNPAWYRVALLVCARWEEQAGFCLLIEVRASTTAAAEEATTSEATHTGDDDASSRSTPRALVCRVLDDDEVYDWTWRGTDGRRWKDSI
ncbi:hypothetical protein GGTG_06129, partial [Gaeumannomyces tritici R3-111a-1]